MEQILVLLKKNGLTPSHIALQKCHKDIVKLLVSHGTNVNITNKYHGFTPFLNSPLDTA